MKLVLAVYVLNCVLLYSVFGVHETYVVGNRSSGMMSTFPILLVAAFVLTGFVMVTFEALWGRIRRIGGRKDR